MFVKQVNYFDGYEAKIVVSDGTYDIICYYYNYPALKKLDVGLSVKSIHALYAKEIMRVDDKSFKIVKDKELPYGYKIIGKVIDKKFSIIKLGEIVINLDCALPQDICEGEYIEAFIHRLDCEIER